MCFECMAVFLMSHTSIPCGYILPCMSKRVQNHQNVCRSAEIPKRSLSEPKNIPNGFKLHIGIAHHVYKLPMTSKVCT